MKNHEANQRSPACLTFFSFLAQRHRRQHSLTHPKRPFDGCAFRAIGSDCNFSRSLFFVDDDERWMEKGSARPKGNKFGIRNVFGARTQTETFEINHLISRFLSLLPAYNQ